MKKILRGILMIAASAALLSACSKSKKVECPPVSETLVAIPPSLYFNIVDKSTGQNLFLSANPKYDTSQLRIFYRWMSPNQKIPLNIDSTRRCFMIASYQDSLFIQIANLPSDTLLLGAIKGYKVDACTTLSYIDSVKFDDINYVAGSNQVITLKK